jgi:diacylglycerol kinase (ATP)
VKGQPFHKRMGFALAGIAIVFRREQTFRIQWLVCLVSILAMVALRPGWTWAALVMLSIGLVLAAELFNGAIEYLIDRIHPDIHDEIKFAKDAAAGAVLLTSIAAASVGIAMLISSWPWW